MIGIHYFIFLYLIPVNQLYIDGFEKLTIKCTYWAIFREAICRDFGHQGLAPDIDISKGSNLSRDLWYANGRYLQISKTLKTWDCHFLYYQQHKIRQHQTQNQNDHPNHHSPHRPEKIQISIPVQIDGKGLSIHQLKGHRHHPISRHWFHHDQISTGTGLLKKWWKTDANEMASDWKGTAADRG